MDEERLARRHAPSLREEWLDTLHGVIRACRDSSTVMEEFTKTMAMVDELAKAIEGDGPVGPPH